MEVLEIARWQFGITTVYHFFFSPLTMGLAVLVAILQTLYYRTGNNDYKKLTKFFGKLFVIIFALGVVTGIVLEFQFGMAWSRYSRFVGDIFGIPLAIEALLAFFLESTFIAVWLFGWNRLPKGLHLLSIWLVAIGSNLSAIWIIIANAWMQMPVGYILNNGRAELNDFVAVMLNEQMLVMAQHTIIAAFTTGGLFMLGISAWHILRKNQSEIFIKSAQVALVFTMVAALLVATTGHKHAQHTVKHQPMKMAAMEGLWESEQPASFSLFAIIDQENRTSIRELRLPYLTTVLAYNNLTSEVKGMKNLQKEYKEKYGQGDYLPPVAIVYWSFRFMVGLGMLFILFSIFGLVLWWRKSLKINRLYLRLATIIMFLPFLANSFGWIVAEMGRQPWLVHGLMLTSDGVSPNVSSNSMLMTTILFTIIYGLLAAVAVYLVHRFAKPGVPEEDVEHAY
ncbi:MAG: cytochrome ubiquinol oxidase subunit I [Bacteroidetes bacterium]|jgi:cytochrome d ubiquinol oxidase subunit I|nr:cytochrome ubiquinol oxidase subunit I [Bacteroidota bacterium]